MYYVLFYIYIYIYITYIIHLHYICLYYTKCSYISIISICYVYTYIYIYREHLQYVYIYVFIYGHIFPYTLYKSVQHIRGRSNPKVPLSHVRLKRRRYGGWAAKGLRATCSLTRFGDDITSIYQLFTSIFAKE